MGPLQRTFRTVGIGWIVLALAVAAAAGEPPGQPRRAERDVTFLVTSDAHYDAFENEDRNDRVRDTLRHMNEIAGVAWPGPLGGDPIEKPRGVLVLGDVLDDGDRMFQGKVQGAQQWAYFVRDFGLDGTDGLLKFPVLEGAGNHDGPPAGREKSGFSFQAELKKRNALRKQKGRLANLAENGLHYSWDWDDVHFVQLNLYPADKQHEGIKYSPAYHDPQGALTFLKQDLAAHARQRRVVLMSHCGFDTDWWHPEDWKAAYEAAKPYNVILYLYGHTGTGLREWKPEGEERPLQCVNTGQTENGFFVVQILQDRLRLAYRIKQWTQTKTETGPPKKTWTGQWEWKHLLEKQIPAPAAGSTPPSPAPAEVKPAAVKPAEAKPAEVKPAEVKPAETKPAPAQEKAVVVDRPDTTLKNDYYAGNRPPLLPSPLIKLPTGSIRPEGWLRKQLELEADGFTGHLPEISRFCKKDGSAWLSPEGKGHSGWEEVPYWFRGFCNLGYVLGDKRIIDEAKPFIEALIASQQEDGYFGPRANLGDGKRGPDLMPNMSMLAALQCHYEATGDKRILDLMTRYFRWELQIPDKQFFAGGWQVPRGGDNMASVYWLYNQTGEKGLLDLAEKLQRTGASWMNTVTGCHNVDFSQGFRKPAQFYQQSHDPKFLQASERNWESIYGIYGQVPGGLFGGDEFARPGYTDPRQGIETCGIVEMMKSEIILLRITGDPKWADRCENAAVNTLPAAMTADLKALRYLTSPNQVNSDKRSKEPELADGGPMQVMNPHDHRCCQHNVGMGWPYFAESLWHATPGNGLAAVFYAACEVRAKVGGGTEVAIKEDTAYPFDGAVEFTLSAAAPVRFPLHLRVPAWCRSAEVAVNGRKVAVEGRPRAYLVVDRTWASGDKVRLALPMDVAITRWEKNGNSVSVNLGPVTFSLRIGEQYVRAGGTDQWPAWEILPTTPWNYGLVLDEKNPAASLEIVRKPWPVSGQPFVLDDAPVELRAKARKIDNWKEDHVGLVGRLQPSPVKAAGPVETVTLVPMGAARLRLAAFPVIGDGPDAHAWALPPEPMASFQRARGSDPIEAINDGKVPSSSYDTKTPRFTWWSRAQFGKKQWVQQNLDGEKTVTACEVYWFDESPKNADCRAPKSWRLLYNEGSAWKEVKNPSGYGVEVDKFNTVTFDPVKTGALRLEVQCQERRSAGVYEWRIK
ncbi:MAG: glycoside hydrolase family 127 protein [Planctomycetota bacterium]|nr:glycoside hydrolase family 127 protein [Planctomycetota bacterium]